MRESEQGTDVKMNVLRAYDNGCNQYRIDFSIRKVSYREGFESSDAARRTLATVSLSARRFALRTRLGKVCGHSCGTKPVVKRK